ncbi:MAG: hypothetical protein HY296_01225 [Thaumarchaeota archaeon]|nr:hypothetical protein [Nitrososphaerota archaeon]
MKPGSQTVDGLFSAVVIGVVLIIATFAAYGSTNQLGNAVTSAVSTGSEEVRGAVAVVQPTFTSTAYRESISANGGFYTFYAKYASSSAIILQDLTWLELRIPFADGSVAGWGTDFNLYAQVLANYSNAVVVTDPQVDGGALFASGTRRFEKVFVLHEEYVTAREYTQFKQFVASGGELYLMYGDELEVLVNYSSGVETFVAGHGWAFNGTAAYKSQARPFETQNENWVGSSYYPLSAGNETFRDSGAEFNALLNFTGTSIVRVWRISGNATLAYYTHIYGLGKVVCYCRSPVNALHAVVGIDER